MWLRRRHTLSLLLPDVLSQDQVLYDLLHRFTVDWVASWTHDSIGALRADGWIQLVTWCKHDTAGYALSLILWHRRSQSCLILIQHAYHPKLLFLVILQFTFYGKRRYRH